MERKIGEIFEHNGDWYQCVFGDDCKNCAFIKVSCSDDYSIGYCVADNREDNKDVIFKKLEKVGEPFSCDYYDDSPIMMQEYNLYNLDDVTNEDNIPMYITDYKHKRIAIEIKQNKEDMEENKITFPKENNALIETIHAYVSGKISDKELIKSIKEMSDEYPYNKNNLKPFDLEAAKAGKPVCTRDGRKARIVCFDKEGSFHLVVLITRKEDLIEDIRTYSVNGISSISYNRRHPEDHNDDLMMLPEKREGGWINIYEDMVVYESKEEAELNASKVRELIATVKIEWEE